MGRIGRTYRRLRGRLMGRPTNFSWVLEGRLAGSGRPTTLRELRWMKDQGVGVVISLTEEPLPEGWIREVGIGYIHTPLLDHEAPPEEKIDEAADVIREKIVDGRAVAVHCSAGRGRTGTILAGYLMKYHGMTAADAVKAVRRVRPFSIEGGQEEALQRYYEKLRGNVDSEE